MLTRYLFICKKATASVLTTPLIGKLIAWLWSDKIPYYGGITILTNHNSITPSIKATIFWRLYETAELRFIRRYVPNSTNVIDLGSSIGIMSTFIAKYKNPSLLICVEPNPSLCEVITDNLNFNECSPFIVLNAAVSTLTNSDLWYVKGRDNLTGYLSLTKVEECSKVPLITLSALIKNHSIEDYTLVVDIEGSEIDMILNDANSLSKCKLIIIEMHSIIWNGVQYTPDRIAIEIERLSFKKIDQYGTVMVFERI